MNCFKSKNTRFAVCIYVNGAREAASKGTTEMQDRNFPQRLEIFL